jgi:hypothetical protein
MMICPRVSNSSVQLGSRIPEVRSIIVLLQYKHDHVFVFPNQERVAATSPAGVDAAAPFIQRSRVSAQKPTR